MSLHLQREMSYLEDTLLRVCAQVEKSLNLAISSLMNRDPKQATEVLERDIQIDRMEVDTEEDCLKILALHQPVAIDLRFIVAALKINNDLERIGDLAVNIAERAIALAESPRYPAQFDFQPMATAVSEMLRKSVDALVQMDLKLANWVREQDDSVDQMNLEMNKLVIKIIQDGSHAITELIHLLSISRHLERIADHATNIAEDVIYMCTGKIVRHEPGGLSKADE